MDPTYFLDNLELDDDENISEYTDFYPSGDWVVDAPVYYNRVKYSQVKYNNDTKEITFYKENVISMVLRLTLVEISN